MTPKTAALAGILLAGLIAGASDVLFSRWVGMTKLLVEVGPMVVGLAFVFMWLHYDGLQVGYRRSPLFNIGIAALGIVFIPIYLYRSRVPGQRALAFMRFIGIGFLWFGVSAVGYYGALAAT
jgi:hypothetical protein